MQKIPLYYMAMVGSISAVHLLFLLPVSPGWNREVFSVLPICGEVVNMGRNGMKKECGLRNRMYLMILSGLLNT